MDKPSFVYTTYIPTTPEKLWQARTPPAFTPRYWNNTVDTHRVQANYAQAELEDRASMSFVESKVRTMLTAITGQ